MLALPLLAAAAALVPPVPASHDLVTNDNFPQWALRREKSAGIIYTVFVTPDGTIASARFAPAEAISALPTASAQSSSANE